MPNSPGLRPFRAELIHWINSQKPFTLHRETDLDGRVAELRLPPAPASRGRMPRHLGIKPTSRDIATQCPAGQWIEREPRCFSAELYNRQFFVLYFVGDQLLMATSYHPGFKQ